MESVRSKKPIRVVIVDDARAMRAMIRAVLTAVPDIDVVGEAASAQEAEEIIGSVDPDVITLDLEMPQMHGLDYLEGLMRRRPMPVIVVSAKAAENSRSAVRALSLGAVDCIDSMHLFHHDAEQARLIDTVLAVGNQQPFTRMPRGTATGSVFGRRHWNGRVVAIGASTGGVDALIAVLSKYPKNGPPTVIAQHMPASFLASFTARLDRLVAPDVVPVWDGMSLECGMICVAPGGADHVAFSATDPRQLLLLPDDGSERYVPSVDVMFSSAEIHGPSVVGVLLTGMGRDGAEALGRMRAAGAHTIVQDAKSAVVDGMPGAARRLNAASEVASIETIAERILAQTLRSERTPA